MGWLASVGEFIGSAGVAFLKTSHKLNKRAKALEKDDFCPKETKIFIANSLQNCHPASEDLTRWGRIMTKYSLDKNDYLGSLLAIDANAKSTRRIICIEALKVAAKCICAGYDEEGIRAVTYSYLALRQAGLE